MALTVHDQQTCAECCDWCGFYDWEGNPRGGMCEQSGDYFPEPRFGDWFQLPCHSIWDRLED